LKKPTIEEFTKYLLSLKGFELDKYGELRHYNFLFWNLEKEIINKKIKEYEQN